MRREGNGPTAPPRQNIFKGGTNHHTNLFILIDDIDEFRILICVLLLREGNLCIFLSQKHKLK